MNSMFVHFVIFTITLLFSLAFLSLFIITHILVHSFLILHYLNYTLLHYLILFLFLFLIFIFIFIYFFSSFTETSQESSLSALNDGDVKLLEDDIIVEKMHIHYGLKEKNPVTRIRFYEKVMGSWTLDLILELYDLCIFSVTGGVGVGVGLIYR